jgi:hypothetical protein
MRKPVLLQGIFLIVILITSCTKDPVIPTVYTLGVNTITSRSAILQGNIESDGGSPITEFGICWDINENPTIDNNKLIITGENLFESNILNLSSGVTYYAKAYAINKAGISYGESVSFTTADFELTKSSDFPGQARVNPLSFTFNGKGYYGLGETLDRTFLKDFWSFDPSTSSWTRLKDCPFGFDFFLNLNLYSTKCLAGSTLYIPQMYSIYTYDINLDNWILAGHTINSLYNTSCFSVDGKAFFFRIGLADLYEFIPETATLKKKNAVISNFGYAELNEVFVINNEAYMINKNYENIEIFHYQSQSDTWEKKLEKKFTPNEFRNASFITILGNCAFIGQSTSFTNIGTVENPVVSADSPSSNIWKYDCIKNEFMQCATMPGDLRTRAGSFSFVDKAYIIGGLTLDQSTKKFKLMNDMWMMSR